MGITKQQAKRLRNLMTRRVNAAIKHSWKGGGDPMDIPQIEEDLWRAEENLDTFIRELIDS